MKTNYENELSNLRNQVGRRNSQLLRLANLGLREGRDPNTMQNEIIAAGGEPRLTDKEVRRAIDTAMRKLREQPATRGGFKRHKGPNTYHAKPIKRETQPNPKEVGFVREMIAAGEGATEDDLKVREFDVAAFLRRLFKPGELIFAGTPRLPRIRENLKTLEQMIDLLSRRGATMPTHFIPNPFTGEPGRNSEGKVSYCLDSTVAHRRMALVEFDALSLEKQLAFWKGAIKTRTLPVRSLVYSGAKSIHGLIELREDVSWEGQWQTLERLLCSDPDAAYHADRACKNVSRLTRFPGAIRPETGKLQRLVWCG